MLQTLLFAIIQLTNFNTSTAIDIVSLACAILVLLMYLAYMFWLTQANVKPIEDHITVDEQREVYGNFKLRYKLYVLFSPLRKIGMALALVFLQNYPTW